MKDEETEKAGESGNVKNLRIFRAIANDATKTSHLGLSVSSGLFRFLGPLALG